ncbi:hotdog fold thioesterase [Fictibacillus terranigra]|uniref:Hotdog fold thioesterase n=1 Tax=Fictibacillus terranigra TaxID=3058424 RepID=A0ABT8E5H7_9BACL|nr:hotdog fold thioesterase [Fictibacillus sp. CENA-BCM004]MDN4073162.1 hotdog fold thioesterase [Fictibacillus sp. CENA-BCM004]
MDQKISDERIHQTFRKEIFEIFENEPYAKFLGIKLTDIGEGTAAAEVQVQPHMLNSHGTAHGAVIFALADFVFAAACNSYGKTSVGLSTTVNFMAAGKAGSKLKAVALEEKKNNRTSWYNIKVESEGELIASMEALAYRKSRYFVPVEKMDKPIPESI